MDQGSEMGECTRKWWQFSVIAGAVVAVLLLLFGYGFLTALVLGIVIAVAAGLILSKVKCVPEAETPAIKSPVMAQAVASPVATAEPSEPAAATPEVKAETPPVTAEAPVAKKAPKKPAPKANAKKAAPKKAAPAAKKAPAKPAATKAPTTSARAPVAADGKPEMLSAPRAGGADDLKLLKGVGPKLEGTLNDMGVYHFDQVAGWRKKEIEWVDDRLKFKGRIERDEWIKQAKVLAKGGATEFSKRSKKS